MSPDPGPWELGNPQAFNRYTYGLNNPLRYTDDDGLTPQDRVAAANRFASMNIPYKWGGKDPSCGLDCSGLVQNVFKADPDNHIGLGLNAAGQAGAFEDKGEYSTDVNDAQAGDAIFFENSGGQVVHTGIVVDVRDGKVYFVHAPHTGAIVRRFYIKLNHPFLGKEKFAGVGRPIESGNRAQNQRGFFHSVGGYMTSMMDFMISMFNSQQQQQPKERVSHTITPCGGESQKPCQQ